MTGRGRRAGTHSPGPVTLAVVLAGLLVAVGVRRADAQTPSGTSAPDLWSVTARMDVANRYLFRGHQKDERGAVIQTSFGASIRPLHGVGLVRELAVSGLVWSSLHAATRVHPGDVGLFELDLGLGVDATLANGWGVGVLYTTYLAPTGAFDEVHEVALGLYPATLAVGDVLQLSTRVLLAQEIDDGGGPEDTYLELGADVGLPSIDVVQWTALVTVGLSVDGFYRDERGDNELLGFVATGLDFEVALSDVGIGWNSARAVAGFSLAFENPEAGLTRDPPNDVLWTLRAGLGVAIP